MIFSRFGMLKETNSRTGKIHMSELLFAQVAVARAQNALMVARDSLGVDQTTGRKAFAEIARTIAKSVTPEAALAFLQSSKIDAVAKAADAHVLLDDVWRGPEAQALAASFVASVGEPDVLSAIARYGRAIPKFSGRVLVATGTTGNTTAEGFPKLIKNLDLAIGGQADYQKSLAAVVVNNELLTATSEAGTALFEGELIKAVIRACNAAVIASLIDSNTEQVAAGADPLASLRAGIRAAGASDGYVVTAPAGDVAWLATHEANRGGMGVRGGEFVPGIQIAAIDDASTMTVIPASRLALIDGGVELRPAGHATVDMSDTPQAAGQKVSLWQTGCVGLLVERFWRIDGDTSSCVVVG